MYLKKLIFFILIFISGELMAQQGGFEIEFINGKMEDESSYQLMVMKEYDTIEDYTFEYRHTFYKDYLYPGDYTFFIRSSNDYQLVYIDTFSIIPNKITYAKEIFNQSVQHFDADYETSFSDSGIIKIDKRKTELQFIPITCGSNLMLDKNNPVKHEFGICVVQNDYWFFTKHIGVFGGFGLQFSQSYFKDDSSLVSLNDRFWERYSGLNFPFRFGLRTTSQSSWQTLFGGIIFDLGISYYLPVLFRHTAIYSHKKISAFNIHQYTDLRAFITIGVPDGGLFFEYRITDFINGNKPELPKFRIGINFFIDN